MGSLQSLKHCGIAVTELTEFARLLAPATPYDRRELGMADPTSTFDWTLHIVLACITYERVILFTRPNKDLKVAHEASRAFMRLIPADPNTQKTVDGIVSLFFMRHVCIVDITLNKQEFYGNVATIFGDEGF